MLTSVIAPRREVLERGVVLGAIVNATKVAQDIGYAQFLSWDGRNYVVNGCDGTYGALTFARAGLVGTFFDASSELNRISGFEEICVDRALVGIPPELRPVAVGETLKFNRQQRGDRIISLVTAAFWSEGERLAAAFPWNETLRNGARVVKNELIDDFEDAMQEWADGYQLSTEETGFIRLLFRRKLRHFGETIVMSANERDWLIEYSTGAEALAASRMSFQAGGIVVD